MRTPTVEESFLMDEIFGTTNPLAEIKEDIKEPITVWLEVTMNYPRTKPFIRMDEKQQQMLYFALFHSIINLHKHNYEDFELHYEKCLDGHTHAHGWIKLKMQRAFSIEGVVSMTVREYVHQLPKRTWAQLNDYKYSRAFSCWKLPCILVQYTSDADEIRLIEWNEYIRKNAPV